MASNSKVFLNPSQYNLLCFGFTRQWFQLINNHIQIDDIANIIVKYTMSFNLGFIYHPNYCKVFFSDDKSNDIDDNINHNNDSILQSSRITCNFNVDPTKGKYSVPISLPLGQIPDHYSSTVIFTPFLSQLLHIDHDIDKNVKSKKCVRFTVILKKNKCGARRDGYKFHCGLFAIPKRKVKRDMTSNNDWRQIFLKQFEMIFTNPLVPFIDHTCLLSQLPHKLMQQIDKLKSNDEYKKHIKNINGGIISACKHSKVIHADFIKSFSRGRCTFGEKIDNSKFVLNDFVQFCIDNKNDDNQEYIINIKKGLAQDGLKNDFSKSQSMFDGYINIIINTSEKNINSIENKKLNFNKYDYLFAICSSRCLCYANYDQGGFEFEVFVEQF